MSVKDPELGARFWPGSNLGVFGFGDPDCNERELMLVDAVSRHVTFGRDRVESGHRVDIGDRSRLT